MKKSELCHLQNIVIAILTWLQAQKWGQVWDGKNNNYLGEKSQATNNYFQLVNLLFTSQEN